MRRRLLITVLSVAIALVGCGVSPNVNPSASLIDPGDYLTLAEVSEDFMHAEALILSGGNTLDKQRSTAIEGLDHVTLVVPTKTGAYYLIATFVAASMTDVSVTNAMGTAIASITDGTLIIGSADNTTIESGASLGGADLDALFTLVPIIDTAGSCNDCDALEDAADDARSDWERAKVAEVGAGLAAAAVCATGNVVGCAAALLLYDAAADAAHDARDDMDDAYDALDDCILANCHGGGGGGSSGGH